jgi:hypothetical protein
MHVLTRRQIVTSLLASATVKSVPAWQRDASALSLTEPAENGIPADYAGLSYETMQLADPSFFAADNRGLVSLFRCLTPRGVLRIGGNSSEFCWWKTRADQVPPPYPSSAGSENNWMPRSYTPIEPVAIDRLTGFLDATGWKAIYGLNLGTGTPERAAVEAEYVAKTLGNRLLFFQIGNDTEY